MNLSRTALTLAGACALLWSSSALTQEDPAQPARADLSRLGDVQSVVSQALLHSAEVRLAAARVEQAQLELTQARMAVVRQVVGLSSDLKEAENRIQIGQQELDQAVKLMQSGMVSQGEVLQAEAELVALKGQVQRMQLELDFLTGKVDLGGTMDFRGLGGAVGQESRSQQANPLAPSLREKLQGPFEASFKNVLLGEVVNAVLQGTGVKLVDEWGGLHDPDYMITLAMTGSRHEWLTAVADIQHLVFVVRDYGLLLTDRENARSYDAPTIPADFNRGR